MIIVLRIQEIIDLVIITKKVIKMAVKEILEIWDENGLIQENIDFLLKKTNPVQFPLSNVDQNIITDLVDTFKKIPSSGIAANQIGYEKRIFIGYHPDEDNYNEEYEIYINPEIILADPESIQLGTEGCLSVPNITVSVKRYDKITVRYYNIEGEKIEIDINRFISRLFQHELDHLNGRIVFHRNPTGFISSRELLSEMDMENLFRIVDEQINKETTNICPFLQTDRLFPLFGKKIHKCSAQEGIPDCTESTEVYCLTVDHNNCEYYDERLIL